MKNKSQIQKPKLPDELLLLNNLRETLLSENCVEEKIIRDLRELSQDFSQAAFRKTFFENCRLGGCSLKKSGFSDVCFKNCDMSNVDFSNNYFARCEFVDCKLVGAVFCVNNFQDVSFCRCSLEYANFDNTKFENTSFEDSDLSDSAFTKCRLKNFLLSKSKLSFTNFFLTSLNGVDFSESEIDNLIFSDNKTELKGAIVNPMQAADLALLLGVVIR